MQVAHFIKKITENSAVTLTPLRSAILHIILKAEKPIGAYEILRELRNSRPNAEPPTVYRVLEYLIEHKIVHRIESNNTYYCCQHTDHKTKSHLAQLLICSHCGSCTEILDKSLIFALKKFATLHTFTMNQQPIEIYGICAKCAEK